MSKVTKETVSEYKRQIDEAIVDVDALVTRLSAQGLAVEHIASALLNVATRIAYQASIAEETLTTVIAVAYAIQSEEGNTN